MDDSQPTGIVEHRGKCLLDDEDQMLALLGDFRWARVAGAYYRETFPDEPMDHGGVGHPMTQWDRFVDGFFRFANVDLCPACSAVIGMISLSYVDEQLTITRVALRSGPTPEDSHGSGEPRATEDQREGQEERRETRPHQA